MKVSEGENKWTVAQVTISEVPEEMLASVGLGMLWDGL